MTSLSIQFTGINTEATEALRNFTTEKFERLHKFAPTITSVHVIFNVDKLRHIAEANIHIPKNEVHAKAESDDMYKTIDELVDKLSRQLLKLKEKATDH